MFNRNTVMLVAGGAFFALSSASAQTKPTSSRRIPVSKEAPGEVAAPRVDTVTVYKTDTLRTMGRVDTVTVTNRMTVHDTVTQSIPMVTRHMGGLYFGLGGGVALPYGSIRTVNEPGEYGQIQVGYQGLNSPLGVRLDGTLNKYARNPEYGTIPFGDRSTMMGLNGDVRLNLPFFNAMLGSSVRLKPYLIGGGSYVRYNNLRMKLDADNGTVVGGYGPAHAVIAINDGGTTTADSDWHGDWGFNAGGGLGFHSGKKEIWIESRFVRFNHASNNSSPNLFHAAYNVPIAFGVNFF